MPVSRDLERQSSAVTLSDMEIFIFPEILYSLVLANIMSPRIWAWRQDPWFDGLDRMKPYRRITRLKQFIMDHYAFNLDLDTWGLTTQERELARFSDFIGPDALRQSNALFGYEGDKYYFDIGIRTHFGLDKYQGNVIPYWKTETVEAMDAFRHKPNYATGAGECVSLAALYAAALFVVARVPLKDIYLLATPLHSQNFVDVDDGILTNNRRLVTKTMWFNGTELSAQARRALENEQVTVVTHETGCIHVLYPEATISRTAYDHFSHRLRDYLHTRWNDEIFGNFLRHDHTVQQCFQMRWPVHGVDHYIGMEKIFAYEEGTQHTIAPSSRARLMAEIDSEEFQCSPIEGRIVFNDMEAFIQQRSPCTQNEDDVAALRSRFAVGCMNAQNAIERMTRFCCIQPRLPDAATKQFVSGSESLGIDLSMDREAIRSRLETLRGKNAMVDLAFHAYRDLNRVPAEPFLIAAVQRNPVSIEATRALALDDALTRIRELPDESIYDEDGRLAQPDEVWNYGRGDGAEKAVLAANLLRSRLPGQPITVEVSPDRALCRAAGQEHAFASRKGLKPATWAIPG